MSARRQASTTSLSRYARAGSPDFTNRSLDFCNAFWGLGDGGVDVLFARMRGAIRTMEELKAFWKERASIEEQYAKRLASLAKSTLGRDEIGELRTSLDTLKQETDKQAQAHLVVAQAIKADLEGHTAAFVTKQQHHKRGIQAQMEKDFKTKQTQEGYVARAREKYESDCMRINSYTAQSTLIQGKDLEKVHLKLERAQQTVQANQRDYANFARALQDTLQKWEQSWKAFCDSCQDLEEERIEFMKDNMWAYANAISTVCVSDDESCEKLRLALEQLEVERDMEGFVRDYGTGNSIPDPPSFIDYSSPDAQPPSSQRVTSHSANFPRQSQRPRQPIQSGQGQAPQPEPEEEPVNYTGVGAGNRAPSADPPLQRWQTQSRASTRGYELAQPQPQTNGAITNGRITPNVGTRVADPQADPIDPTAKTMLKVGPNAYEVNLDKDPQAHAGPTGGSSIVGRGVGLDDDPLAQQMNQLKNAGSVRRSGQWKFPQQQTPPAGSGAPRDPNGKLSPPVGGGAPPPQDYRNSAEFVVGAYPHKRPRRVSVQSVLADYQQSLPGERKSIRKSISRSNSRSNSISISAQDASSIRDRPLSSESGRAGIGAQGRSTSPQPFAPVSRSTSPAMQSQAPPNRNSFVRPPTGNGPAPGPGHAHSGSTTRQGSISIPQQPLHQQRPTSPSIGIQLDPTGRVIADDMAAGYQRPPGQQPPAQQPYGAPPQQVPPQRGPSFSGANGVPAPYAPPPQQYPPVGPMYNNVPQQQPQYAPQQVQQPAYGAPQQYPPYQQPQGYPQQQVGALVQQPRGPVNGNYYPQAPSGQQPQQPQQNYRPPSPLKAMYNYRATIDEEFDFQEGDIIAVTATPEDGWWSGELLDETRRQPGRHIFPSNFVCLF
ncbi:hypothetical protein C8Q80DRAFT_1217267 [Daedaleopsis nitida]|nr:hypothetical protein C8Q80DRAFT_1217267 [Daedaleopsis nitida]